MTTESAAETPIAIVRQPTEAVTKQNAEPTGSEVVERKHKKQPLKRSLARDKPVHPKKVWCKREDMLDKDNQVEANGGSGNEESRERIRLPKHKVALLMSYNGSGYSGMQA